MVLLPYYFPVKVNFELCVPDKEATRGWTCSVWLPEWQRNLDLMLFIISVEPSHSLVLPVGFGCSPLSVIYTLICIYMDFLHLQHYTSCLSVSGFLGKLVGSSYVWYTVELNKG